LADTVWWLFNKPLAITIGSRGSAESLMVLLPVLFTVWIVVAISENKAQQQQQPQQPHQSNRSNRSSRSWLPLVEAAVVAGICHGVAVHAKLYPVIIPFRLRPTFAGSHRPIQP
jgi:GPI mannosyltransferase 1 subunit M